jgi:hypothetical protein
MSHNELAATFWLLTGIIEGFLLGYFVRIAIESKRKP